MDALDAIDRLAAGDLRDDDAIARPLFTVAEPQLRRFALRYLFNRGFFARELRNDSAQEALLRLWKVREQYNRSDTRAFKAWFRRICRSSGVDVLRRSRDPVPTVAAMESLVELPSKDLDDPANDASKFERHRNVKECLEILKRNKPAVYSAVLVTVLMGETERGAALMLGRSKTGVRDDKLLGLRLIEECLRARSVE